MDHGVEASMPSFPFAQRQCVSEVSMAQLTARAGGRSSFGCYIRCSFFQLHTLFQSLAASNPSSEQMQNAPFSFYR